MGLSSTELQQIANVDGKMFADKLNVTDWSLTVRYVYRTNGTVKKEIVVPQREMFPFAGKGGGADLVGAEAVYAESESDLDGYSDAELCDRIMVTPINKWMPGSIFYGLWEIYDSVFPAMICYDNYWGQHSDTYFMSLPTWNKPAISINGSLGREIKDMQLFYPNIKVEFDFEVAQEQITVDSRNVIGRIDVGAPQTVVIGAHYDGWWSEAASDDASGTALLMGLAKWFAECKDNLNLAYNLEFVAFCGEEYGTRGSGYYVHEEKDNKDFKYMVELEMFGHESGENLVYSTKDYTLRDIFYNIADENNLLGHVEHNDTEAPADNKEFTKYADTICFARENYEWYHRSNGDHTNGDVSANILNPTYDGSNFCKTSNLILEFVKELVIQD